MPEYVVSELGVIYLPVDRLYPRQAGENIDLGRPVRLDPADMKLYMTTTDTAANSVCHGLSLQECLMGEWLTYAPPGSILRIDTSVLANGDPAFADAGKLHPYADLATGDYLTQVLIGVNATTGLVKVIDGYTGNQKP
jgi:hypothetical protein